VKRKDLLFWTLSPSNRFVWVFERPRFRFWPPLNWRPLEVCEKTRGRLRLTAMLNFTLIGCSAGEKSLTCTNKRQTTYTLPHYRMTGNNNKNIVSAIKSWPATMRFLTGRTTEDGRTDVSNQRISSP